MCSILGFCGIGGTLTEVECALAETKSRGPDASRILDTGNGWLGFNRLSIMGLTDTGMQPFVYQNQRTLSVSELCEGAEYAVVCNGEIYGFRTWKEELIRRGYSFISDSDCELLPALYHEYGTAMFNMLWYVMEKSMGFVPGKRS